MSEELEQPFVSIAGNGGTYRFTWAGDGTVREIHDGQPQYWILAHLLGNVYGEPELNDLRLVGALRYQVDELERRAQAAAVPSYRIEVGSLSPTAREEIEEFLSTKDYNYSTQEEGK